MIIIIITIFQKEGEGVWILDCNTSLRIPEMQKNIISSISVIFLERFGESEDFDASSERFWEVPWLRRLGWNEV